MSETKFVCSSGPSDEGELIDVSEAIFGQPELADFEIAYEPENFGLDILDSSVVDVANKVGELAISAAEQKDLDEIPALSKAEIHQASFEQNGKTRDKIVSEFVKAYKDHPAVLSALRTHIKRPMVESEDPEKRYYNYANQFDILSFGEEQTLFRQLEDGISSYLTYKSQADEQVLISATIAQRKIFLSNLKLGLRASRYRARGDKIPAQDLAQRANIGINKALNRFDYRRKLKFSTYAYNWIKQEMQRYILEDINVIRIPNYMQEKRDAIFKAREQLFRELGREPSNIEISQKSGFAINVVTSIFANSTLKEIISLDSPLNEEDFTILDTVEEPGKTLETKTSDKIFTEEVFDHVFGSPLLTVKEKYVISMRAGVVINKLMGTSFWQKGKQIIYEDLVDSINSGDLTLQDISDCLGVTRQRIDQIHKKAMNKIHASKNIQSIAQKSEEYFGD